MENKPHSIELADRKQLHISGVEEVVSATANQILMKTGGGPLTIFGSELKIKNLNNTDKEVEIDGEISELKYTQKKKKFFEKVFK